MMKRVLVPLDGAGATEDIMPIVGMLAGGGAAVRLIHVAPVPDNLVDQHGRTIAYVDQEMARIEGVWSVSLRNTAAQLGGDVDHTVRFGDPASQILAEADAFGADTIVVTTGTRSALKRTLLGSVAEEMLRRARIGVLMYRPPSPS